MFQEKYDFSMAFLILPLLCYLEILEFNYIFPYSKGLSFPKKESTL